MYMNLNGIRNAVQIYLSGYPARGTVGEARLDDMINLGLQRLWGDLPTVLNRTETRFMLQKSISTTVEVDSAHSRVMRLTTATTSTGSLLGGSAALRSEWTARWVDITDVAGVVHTFRIRSVFRGTADQGGSTFFDYLVIDRPWVNVTDTGLTARIYTKEYPFPGDVKSIKTVALTQAGGKPKPLRVLDGEEMFEYLVDSGFDSLGVPGAVALGDFYQLPAPRFAPVATLATGGAKWGDDGTDCEPGGSFKYIMCLGWGVRPRADGIVRTGGSNLAQTTTGDRLPFYISSPSEPSAEVTAVWGTNQVLVASPDVSSMFGYPDDAATVDGVVPTSGIKKWVFRARTSTVTGAGSAHDETPADGVYRLWRILDASGSTSESAADNGSYYPLAGMTLSDFYGHRHLRFDKSPDASGIMATARVVMKAPKLVHDSDSPGIPDDAIEALVFAVATIAAHRDAKLERVASYETLYRERIKALRAGYATNGMRDEAFGDGLGMGEGRSDLWGATGLRNST